MKRKIALIAALAVIGAASAVSCGHDVSVDENVSVGLPEMTVASDEQADNTQEAETTKASNEDKSKKDSEETTTATKESGKATGVVLTASNTKPAADSNKTQAAATEKKQETPTEAPAPTEAPTEAQTEAPTEAPTAAPQPGRTDLTFSFGDLLGNASGIVSSLGTPNDTVEATGCLSNGADQKIYKYNNAEVHCYVQGGAEYIYSIKVSGGDFSTDKGIKVGSSRADVEAAYGTGIESGGVTVYESGDKELDITYSGDTVAAFEFYTSV